MAKYIKQKFDNVSVNIDGNEYNNCEFVNCTMVYAGIELPNLVNDNFQDVSWKLTGPAENTLRFLYAVYNGMGEGGRKIVEETFENIKTPGAYGDSKLN